MKLLGIFLIIFVLIVGCAKNPTGQVIIEDVPDNDVTSTTIVEDNQTQEVEEDLFEEPDEKIEEATEVDDTGEVDSTKEISDNTELNETEESLDVEEPNQEVEIIMIKNLKFILDKVTIPVGSKVIWRHSDRQDDNQNLAHLIRIYPGGMLSDRMFYGDEWSYTFTEPGEYRYIDIIHKEDMRRGIIIVEEQ